MVKKVREWSIKAPWGRIAMVAWGDHKHPPILMVHGYLDTAATFIQVVEQLPDKYYYVAFDIPGHGKSDPFVKGMMVSQVSLVEVIRRVIEHMRWREVTYMSHSLGGVLGILYNSIFPGHLKNFIHLDVLNPLSMYYFVNYRMDYWYNFFHRDYYDNYARMISNSKRLYTLDQIISLVVRNRNMTEDQAEVVMSRSLVPMGIDTYRLAIDNRMRKIMTVPMSEETLYTILTSNPIPTLSLEATESKDDTAPKRFVENLMQKCQETLPDHYRVIIPANHDLHITRSELVVPHIERFLEKYVDSGVVSKL